MSGMVFDVEITGLSDESLVIAASSQERAEEITREWIEMYNEMGCRYNDFTLIQRSVLPFNDYEPDFMGCHLIIDSY